MFTDLIKRIELLENRVCELESSLQVSQQVNKLLKKEIDNNEQYSRRKCLIIDGIAPVKTETPEQLKQKIKLIATNHMKIRNIHPDAFEFEFDKCHRIGPVKNNRQSAIIKFKSDNFREHMYRSKKSAPTNVRFRVSLTKRRINLLLHANERVEGIPLIKFAYADINGNTKLLLNQQSNNGRWTLPFDDEDSLDTVINDIIADNPPQSPPPPDDQTEIELPTD